MSTMFGLREAGVLGASVALAGGVAYLIWNLASSSRQKKPGRDGKGPGGKGAGRLEEEAEEAEAEKGRREGSATERTVAAAAASAPNPPEVRRVSAGYTCQGNRGGVMGHGSWVIVDILSK